MSFIDQESPFTFRRILAGIGGIVLVIVISSGFRGAVESVIRPRATPESLVAELESQPEIRDMMMAFRMHYPEEHQLLLERVATSFNEDGVAAASRTAFAYMENFIESKLPHIANAPSSDLQRMAAGTADLYGALRNADVE